VTKPVVAMLMIGLALIPADLRSQTILSGSVNQGTDPTKPASRNGHLTGKERLGEKWNDEQRIDNCKVPFDKRGAKQRSDSCTHTPTG
jgi:hypothetical protein